MERPDSKADWELCHWVDRCEELEAKNEGLTAALSFARGQIDALDSEVNRLQDLHRQRSGLPSKGYVEVDTINEWTKRR